MALSGTLGDFSLTDILQLIGLQRKSGLLVLRHGEEQVSIGFDSGRVVSADSNRRATEHKLGQLLVRTGKLNEERLAEALRLQKATLQRLGHILVENRWVDKQTVRQQLLVQITDTVYELFHWKDGEYDFQPGAPIEWDRGFIEPIPTENLLMEGAQMVDEWPFVQRFIPSRSVVLRATVRAASLLALPDSQESHGSVYDKDIDFGFIPADPLQETAARKRLTNSERAVLRWVDGHRTVHDIAELSGLGTFESFRLMAELVRDGLLEPVTPSGAVAGRGPRGILRAPTVARVLVVVVVALAALGVAASVQEVGRALFPAPRLLPVATPVASAEALSGALGLDRLRRWTSLARLGRLQAALATAFLDDGAWPRSLSDLVARGLVPGHVVRDPWGDPYVLEVHAWGYRLGESPARGSYRVVREYRFSPAECVSGGAPVEVAALP